MADMVVARRYARALFAIAKARDAVRPIQQELENFLAANTACPELLSVLTSDQYPRDQRRRLIEALAPVVSLQPQIVHFFQLLIDKRRMNVLPQIVAAYQACAAELAGIVTARVTTAEALTDREVLAQVQRAIVQLTRKQVQVVNQVRPEILGGVVVQIGDEIYDGSIRTELQRMKVQMMSSAEYGG